MTKEPDYIRLGRRIRHYRAENHMTQEILAARVDVSTSTIAHAENGSSKPSLPLLMRICKVLDVTLDQLVCDSLPIVEAYLNKDFAELLSDCTVQEKQILLDILTASKESLRKHKSK